MKIPWICDTCGAAGEIDAILPAASIEGLTIEGAASATFDALYAFPHHHPVRFWTETV
ncbi:MAG TPA: hypothetical protein VKT49_24425 [Bryobacteraceae bacterium]|nr:hypothetical protein [Bryobacteraceae bacterium]